MRRIAFAVALFAVIAAPSWADTKASIKAGYEAYMRGEFAVALKEWRPLAEQGDSVTQALLGFMYQAGEGVPQDYAEAAKWFHRAAEQGLADAQYHIGFLHAVGKGVSHDNVLSYMWMTLASEQGNEEAMKLRDITAEFMTDAQLTEAQRRAQDWKRKRNGE